MSSSSRRALRTAAAAALWGALLAAAAGCMADRPAETDIPWAAPERWEGVVPLPGGFLERYD